MSSEMQVTITVRNGQPSSVIINGMVHIMVGSEVTYHSIPTLDAGVNNWSDALQYAHEVCTTLQTQTIERQHQLDVSGVGRLQNAGAKRENPTEIERPAAMGGARKSQRKV